MLTSHSGNKISVDYSVGYLLNVYAEWSITILHSKGIKKPDLIPWSVQFYCNSTKA